MAIDDYEHITSLGTRGGPLLFVFHGTGGNEHQFVSLGRGLLRQATIVSPRGDISEQGSARFFRRSGEGNYDMGDLARATDKMTRFVRSQIKVHRPSRVFGLGYSNGANILASTIFAAPDLFDVAALMHPLIPFAPNIRGSLADTHILITAGRNDRVCPPNLTSRLESHLLSHEANVSLFWHEGGHEMRPEEIDATQALFATINATEPKPWIQKYFRNSAKNLNQPLLELRRAG